MTDRLHNKMIHKIIYNHAGFLINQARKMLGDLVAPVRVSGSATQGVSMLD